jgi:hypothetical protein|tara:strand:- start:287 stop:670 length:384 start_codon:yes stop_codon:yes gene_type:complete
MKNRKDSIMFGVTLAITSQIFYAIPFFKNEDSMSILPFLLNFILFLFPGVLGFLSGQSFSRPPERNKHILFAGPMTFVISHQLSKHIGLYESMPLAVLMVVFLASLVMGWRLSLLSNKKEAGHQTDE